VTLILSYEKKIFICFFSVEKAMSPSIVMHDPQMQAGTGQIHRISSDQESLLESRRTTIVSIDLGTTFSAIASAANIDAQYFEIDDLILPPSRVNAQKRYQDARASKKREEVPSVLAYDPITGKPYFGLEVQTALNRGIITEVDKLELLKLLVARRSLPTDTRKSASLEELQQRISKVRRLDPNTGIRSSKRPSIIQMLSDCLSCLWRNALWDLGLTYTPEVVRSWDIRLILCIPAIWHLGEENIMRQAAAMANLPPPDFVFEPEGAAGLYFAEKPEEVDVSLMILAK
jgi:molecular chaperone DnaK (HSP70)